MTSDEDLGEDGTATGEARAAVRWRPREPGLPVGDLPDRSTVTTGLEVPRCALAIGAHPDDIEFGCGATIARWASAGCRVHHLILTDGSKGSWDQGIDAATLAWARREECYAAAATLDGRPEEQVSGDRVIFVDQVDGELRNVEPVRREVVRHLRRLRPEVVLAHDPWRRYRLHPDHRAAGFISVDSVVAARDHLFFPDLGPAPHRPAVILLWEADEPNHVEDARGFDRPKLDALLCHRSQLASTMGMGADAGVGVADGQVSESGAAASFALHLRRQLQEHGSVAGLALGEAFHLVDGI